MLTEDQLKAIQKVAKRNPDVEALLKSYEEVRVSPNIIFNKPFLVASNKLCKHIAEGTLNMETDEVRGLLKIMEIGAKMFGKTVRPAKSHEPNEEQPKEELIGELADQWAKEGKSG